VRAPCPRGQGRTARSSPLPALPSATRSFARPPPHSPQETLEILSRQPPHTTGDTRRRNGGERERIGFWAATRDAYRSQTSAL
jgi:hypothetical protein